MLLCELSTQVDEVGMYKYTHNYIMCVHTYIYGYLFIYVEMVREHMGGCFIGCNVDVRTVAL